MISDDRQNPGRVRRGTRRGERRELSQTGGAGEGPRPVWPGMPGGRYRPLPESELEVIHQGVLAILERTGLSHAPVATVERVLAAGGRLDRGRLCFPEPLVRRALEGMRRNFTLHGQRPEHALRLSGRRVHMGSGGAAPSVLDMETRRYRDATLRDLYDAARLVDALPNVHFFSRSLVARDMPDERSLDLNTAWACLKGTAKHVCVSASHPEHVREIAVMCYRLAGSREHFIERPLPVPQHQSCHPAATVCTGRGRGDRGGGAAWHSGPRQRLRTGRRLLPGEPGGGRWRKPSRKPWPG